MKKPYIVMAVGVGFEPTVRDYRTPVFKTGTLNHSDTPLHCNN